MFTKSTRKNTERSTLSTHSWLGTGSSIKKMAGLIWSLHIGMVKSWNCFPHESKTANFSDNGGNQYIDVKVCSPA
jgi:hypothetical protein